MKGDDLNLTRERTHPDVVYKEKKLNIRQAFKRVITTLTRSSIEEEQVDF